MNPAPSEQNEEEIVDEEAEEVDELTVTELKTRLTDRKWRLNHLYYVIDKSGKKVLFKLNTFQEFLLDNLWFFNIVLKARQHGITTFVTMFFLDAILFENNKSALVIAHTLDDAEAIFKNKIQFAWDNLPSWLKENYKVNTENTRELQFDNGSSIRVSTSGRSGTYQYLHITEFGIICQKYPEKAAEIISGSLNTIHTGQVIFIEATAKGREGYFFDMCQKAMRQKASGVQLTPLDYKFFFFAWWENPDYVLFGEWVAIPIELQKYFEELEALGIKLSIEQKNWYTKKWETQKDEMFSEYPSTPDEAFKAAVEGSYYGKEFDKLYANKRITKVPWDPTIRVDTYWDLGMADMTTIWFVQQAYNEIRIIDTYQNHGEGLQHYIKILESKPYLYGNHYAPHDIAVRELSSGKSRKELAAAMGLHFITAPNLSIQDGIDAVRTVLPRCWFDEVNTNEGVKALIAYKKEWDDKLGTFKPRPLHDWSSHFADAFRIMAVCLPQAVGGRSPRPIDEPEGYKQDKELNESFDPFKPVGQIV